MEVAGKGGAAMNRAKWLVILSVFMMALVFSGACGKVESESSVQEGITVLLPKPRYDSDTSVEEALWQRRSIREYTAGALTLEQVGQLLWAAQGINDPSGKRTAPSAGAIYPLNIYAVISNVAGVLPGVYLYRPDSHSMVETLEGDRRNALSRSSQSDVDEVTINIVITAVFEKIKRQYGDRGIRYVYMEAGHAAQNLYLQVVSLKMGTVVIGAFDDNEVKKVLGLPDNEEPLYIMPVGRTGD